MTVLHVHFGSYVVYGLLSVIKNDGVTLLSVFPITNLGSVVRFAQAYFSSTVTTYNDIQARVHVTGSIYTTAFALFANDHV